MYLYFESNMMFMKKIKKTQFTHSSLERLFLPRGWEEKRTLVSAAKGWDSRRWPGCKPTRICMYVSNVPANERGQKFRAVRSHALNILGIIKHRIGHGWREKDHQAAWTSIGPN